MEKKGCHAARHEAEISASLTSTWGSGPIRDPYWLELNMSMLNHHIGVIRLRLSPARIIPCLAAAARYDHDPSASSESALQIAREGRSEAHPDDTTCRFVRSLVSTINFAFVQLSSSSPLLSRSRVKSLRKLAEVHIGTANHGG